MRMWWLRRPRRSARAALLRHADGIAGSEETALPTPLGNNPTQINYEDYRDTGSGVKFPYLITMYPASEDSIPATTATLRVSKVQDNAPLDNTEVHQA